jgi:hypothetical protein
VGSNMKQLQMYEYWNEEVGDHDYSALSTQIGGTHYKDMAIQPLEFIMANDLSFVVGNIVKYACRFDKKGQSILDLQKVIHYAQILIEEENRKTLECKND